MNVENVSLWPLDRLAPHMSDILGAMGKLAKRYPDDMTTQSLFQEFLTGKKTLWMALDDEGKFLAMAMTTVRTVDATGARIFTLCNLAGSGVAKFQDELTAAMEASAAENDCPIIAVEGRDPWDFYLKKRGFKRYASLWRKTR